MDKAWRERVLEWTRTSQNMYGDPSKGKSFPNEHRFSMEERVFPNRQGPYPWGVGSWGVGPVVPPSLRSVQTSDNPLQSLGPFVSPPLVYPQTSVNPSQSLGPRPLDLLNRFPQRDHTQIPLETISEVSISTSRHSLQSDAGVAEGEDENSPVEEDGHDKRVSSSYPQSSLQFGRLTPTETSVVSDEQRDALSALRDHDVSRGDRQPDQYHLRSAEYNLDNLVGRPNDWRWDYGVRRTIDAGARTSIDGAFRSAPMPCNQSQLTSVLLLNRIQRPNRTYNFCNPLLRSLKHVCHVRSALLPGLKNALFPHPWACPQPHRLYPTCNEPARRPDAAVPPSLAMVH
ncbi:hypothetical protein H2248_010248 [Termitomyces sp. 'cryptogamus']|nr:hypothetical protein H2248_010248 [Termitomyces sp. 'cryptogamus']